MNPSLIFVHLGPTLPAYLPDALRQARAFTTCPIHLVVEAVALATCPIDPALDLTVTLVEELGLSERNTEFRAVSRLDRSLWNGFWTFTTERFFIIETLMAQRGLENVIHLENDNLLYVDPMKLVPVMAQLYPAIAATFDNDDRCIPGIVYLRDATAVGRLNDFLLKILGQSPPLGMNDMVLLGLYRRFAPDEIGLLPIMTPDYPARLRSLTGHEPVQPEIFSNNFQVFHSVFDAAALGQYLGGIDPRNKSGDTRGFVNESCVFDPRLYTFASGRDERGRRLFFLKTPMGNWRINNLHIHSKNLKAFLSL